MRWRQIIVAALLISSIGCRIEPKPPTEADGRQVWTNIAKQSGEEDIVQLVDFKKTDGQMAEVNGVKVYTFYYEAREKHLTKMGQWNPGDIETSFELWLSEDRKRVAGS